MEISQAQAELRHAYVHGGPGTIISGIIWLVTAIAEANYGVATGFAILFFGGMLIFPLAKMAVQLGFRRPPESKQNPGGLTVVETVFPMIGGLFTAWLFLPEHPDYVFPIAAFSVGAHYFGFRTAYGDWTFWILGAVMCLTGIASLLHAVPPRNIVAMTIAGIEIAFGFWFLIVDFRKQSSQPASDNSSHIA